MSEVRFASFNASLNRGSEGQLVTDLSTPDNEQAQNVAEIIQRTNPDVVLINEFDFDAEGEAAELFQQNYLSVGQNGADAVDYPFVYIAPSNTGIPSGEDFDNDGTTDGPNDAFGFGFFPGQFGMALFSKYEIDTDNVRTFQEFLWKDMPDALLPDDPDTPEPNDWYSEEELEVFRLSSKNHWDVPINVDGEIVHVLASHPTPPVFDGPEDRNGTRNHDEIRFWSDYITPGANGYIYDDSGTFGGLAEGERFVIMGDQNADPFDGDSTDNAILQILDNPLVNTSVTPASEGGVDASDRQGLNNATQTGDPAFDTADFAEENFGGPGNVRVDYVLPSVNTEIIDAGVFWPTDEDPLFRLTTDFPPSSSDHRLVFADVEVTALPEDISRKSVADVELLGEVVTFETGTIVAETELGGISGLAYDAANGVYYALSDDRSQNAPARFYTASIDLSDGSLDAGDVTFLEVTTLTDAEGNPFPEGGIDPEGIALRNNGSLFISSEGDANNLLNPFVNGFSLGGEQFSELPVPDKFLPTADSSSGIRNNQAFESLTISPDGRFLFAATENALFQDGDRSGLDNQSLSRIIKYDLATGQPVSEFVYEVEPIPGPPNPIDSFADNGLVELLAIDNNGTLLALERSFAVGVGNTIKLFEIQTQGALDVSSADSLFDDANGVPFEIDPAVSKRLLVDFADLGVTPDNIEAMSFGPQLEDGRQSVIFASDNNFNDAQTTQFVALGLDIESTPAAQPVVETPFTVDDGDFEGEALLGDSDDPAIWVNPDDASQSVFYGTLKDGGLATFDLAGNVLQVIAPEEFGSDRYNNVDIVYGFAGSDLAVVSDRANDTLAIFEIDSATGELSDITAPALQDEAFSIFGVDDGEATAYGLATYTSPKSGRTFAFVTQADGNQVAQLELLPQETADGLAIDAIVVRTIDLPTPTGDAADSQAEGLVVDRELGLLYVSLEEEVGILKYSAEPDGGDEFSLVQSIDEDFLVPDIEGLSIYYGADGTGYLIANSQGDSSYAVFAREGPNEYLGSFVVGDNGAIDQVNESDGLDVINVPLGDAFPNGALFLQDGANDPQNAVPDEEELENNSTNFKIVPWDGVANAFPVPLDIDTTSFDPRDPQAQSLVNGVASGDVTRDSAVLWARSTFTGEVTFEYSTREDFRAIAGTATATVTDINQPVKVEIDDLNAGTEYFYRAIDAAGDIEVGRFVTAAAEGDRTGLTFGITGDWQQAPPHPILSSAAESELDFFVKLGDTIYADSETPATPGETQSRTLEQFRAKHSEVLSPRFGLSATSDLYATTSILATIDDHEVVDNFAGGAAPGESPDAPDIGSSPDPLFTDDVEFVNDTQVYEDALQAYQEYHPLRDEFYDTPEDDRTDGERKLYRANDYGSDASIFVLDSRSFRDDQLEPVDLANPVPFIAETFDPTRTLLGKPQLELLKGDLLDAQENGTTWKFVVIPEPIQNFGVVNAEDRFEGYAAERAELLGFIDQNGIDNVVFMAGDFHGTIVNNLTYQAAPGQEQIATNAFEIVTGPVAFSDGRFGPNVAALSAAAGFISPEELAFYNALPIAPDADDVVNDRDDFVEQLVNGQTELFGYDPVGLDNNLPEAEGLIDATLLQGDYLSAHTYSWTELDIDPVTQELVVTTFGIDSYTEADVLADPEAIVSNTTPFIVSQFAVNPILPPEPSFGSEGDDEIDAAISPIFDGSQDLVFAGAGEDLVDASTGFFGNNRIFGGSDSDELTAGRGDRIMGGRGDDTLESSVGTGNRLYGEEGNDELFAGEGDRLFGGEDDDLLDSSAGSGGNRLYGEEGNDTFFLGEGDRAIAGDGDDRIFVTDSGNNILTGGLGSDQFWIANGELPLGINTITDFELGTDVLGLGGLGLTFADVELSQDGRDAVVGVGGQAIAALTDIAIGGLDTSSFALV
ncbi:MAG: phytase [Cyanobacteria bacterium J06639_1]